MALRTITRDKQVLSTCGNAVGAPLPADIARERADTLKALADPVRLQLLSIIAGSPDSEACVCDMTELVDVSQSTVSHHLKVLVDAGLLTRQRRGTWAWFKLEQSAAAPALKELIAVTD